MANNPLDSRDMMLLESLYDGSKFVHMGSSPVWAVEKSFSLMHDKLVEFDPERGSNWIRLTAKGREVVNAYRQIVQEW